MSKRIDEKGNKYGYLTVLNDEPEIRNRRAFWHCQCECGNTKWIAGDVLRAGKAKSCADKKCQFHGKLRTKENIIGKRYGFLTVLEKTMEIYQDGSYLYKCKCDCGKEITVSSARLKNRNVQSCGECFLKSQIQRDMKIKYKSGDKNNYHLTILKPLNETNSSGNLFYLCQCDCGNIFKISSSNFINQQSCGKCDYSNENRGIDLTNKRFGKLIVLKEDKKYSGLDKHKHWICKCDCGNIVSVSGQLLRDYQTTSCGCTKMSNGEVIISKMLEDSSLYFEREKKFATCKNKNHLRFDFYINNKYLIEFDGEQHFKETNFFHDSLKEILKRDEIKNQWCKENGIPLIRIPYWHLKDLCIEDLKLETSNFVCVKKENKK